MVNLILAPGLLVHIRRSIIEGISQEELAVKDGSLKELEELEQTKKQVEEMRGRLEKFEEFVKRWSGLSVRELLELGELMRRLREEKVLAELKEYDKMAFDEK